MKNESPFEKVINFENFGLRIESWNATSPFYHEVKVVDIYRCWSKAAELPVLEFPKHKECPILVTSVPTLSQSPWFPLSEQNKKALSNVTYN